MSKLKALLEQKNELKAQAEQIINNAKAESRTLTAEEKEQFDNAVNTISEIDATIEREDKLAKIGDTKVVEDSELTQEQKDVKAFASFIRNRMDGIVNDTSPTQLTKGDNGAVIPTTIADKIIAKVKQISPLYNYATKYVTKGTLTIPTVDTSTDDITVAYATEFSALTSRSNKLSSIILTGFLYGALTKVSKSLVNNSDIDLVNFVVDRMAEKIAAWVENELINGTNNKISGIARSYDSTNMKLTLGAKSSITADELITLKHKIPQLYRANARWLLNPATVTAIKLLKDNEDRYIFNEEDSTLLGKPVDESENVPELGTTGNLAVIFGDFSGLAVKESETLEISILNELFATEHAIGVVGYGELDAKVENTQKIACAACGSSDPT